MNNLQDTAPLPETSLISPNRRNSAAPQDIINNGIDNQQLESSSKKGLKDKRISVYAKTAFKTAPNGLVETSGNGNNSFDENSVNHKQH